MLRQEGVRFNIAWISLAITRGAILLFGLIVTAWPGSSDPSWLRAIGVASVGDGTLRSHDSRDTVPAP